MVVGALAASGVAWLADPGTERALLGATAVMGLASLGPSYIRRHGKRRCLAFFILGLLVIAATRLTSADGLRETGGIVTGAILIATAHMVNLRLCNRCKDCRGETGQPNSAHSTSQTARPS